MPTAREPLSAERVADAALRLIDEHGLAALSMRRLGEALGFEAMAIYKHVADKEALLDLVVSNLYAEMAPADPSTAWSDRLRHIADQLRQVALAHPQLFVRMITRPPGTPSVTAHIDATLAALGDAGLADDELARAFWLFVNATSGALLAESSAMIGPSTLEMLESADVSECVALSQYGPGLATCDFDEVYRVSVDSVLASIGG